ncbi:MAG: Trm112 family protein [Tahibacter sp.]
MDKRLLDILCCPVSKVPVALLAKTQLDTLNSAIRAGGVLTVAGAKVSDSVAAGLITTDARLIYRIEDDIPVMLAEEAIGTTQFQDFPKQ